MLSEECQVLVKRVRSTCIRTTAGTRQFVCNNKFEAIAEKGTSGGGCEEERGEEQDGSENGSQDTEGCRNDPHFVRILLSSSVEGEPLCEIASE